MGVTPNFFVIGAAKAGTTALYRYLSEHPQVCMSTPKEPHFFAPGAGPPHRRVTERAAYEKLFSKDTPVRGEASTSYSMYPSWPGVPERIRALVPEARFIYMVRDPVERLRALFAQYEVPGRGPAEFDSWLGDLHDPANWPVASSCYMTQLRQYLKLFPAERMLVVDHDDLRERRRETLRRVFAFVGVDESFWRESFLVMHNTSTTQRRLSARGARFVKARPVRLASRAFPPKARRVARDSLRRTTGPPEVAIRTRERLADLLVPEVEELRDFTGMSFPGWSM